MTMVRTDSTVKEGARAVERSKEMELEMNWARRSGISNSESAITKIIIQYFHFRQLLYTVHMFLLSNSKDN
jgi:hypothetical protein